LNLQIPSPLAGEGYGEGKKWENINFSWVPAYPLSREGRTAFFLNTCKKTKTPASIIHEDGIQINVSGLFEGKQ